MDDPIFRELFLSKDKNSKKIISKHKKKILKRVGKLKKGWDDKFIWA